MSISVSPTYPFLKSSPSRVTYFWADSKQEKPQNLPAPEVWKGEDKMGERCGGKEERERGVKS